MDNTPQDRLFLRRLALGMGLAVVLLIVLVAYLSLPGLSRLLYDVTGEEAAFAQLKGVTDLLSDLPRPRPATSAFAPIAHAGVPPFGINVFLEQEVESEKRERAVQMIADAGFHWLRQEFPWEDIEIHGPGDFEDRRHEPARSAWEKYDHIVGLAERYGLQLIVRLSNPPEWTRAQGAAAGTFAPPDDYNRFGDFVEAVVRRYQGRVRYYQIWNEPNIYPEWGEAPVSAAAYTELLKIAYTRAKAVDPDVVIISGALASTIALDYRNLNDFLFLQQMYDAGAAAYFDVLGMQGYGLWSGPSDRRMQPRVLNFSHVLFIRDIMVRNGDAGKAIWFSEMNWNAVPDEVPDKRFGQVSEETQARYVVAAYARAQAEWPWLGVINFWYFKRPDDLWKREQKPEYYFRMVEPDFTPLPVYAAIKAYAAQPPVVHVGMHQEDHWVLTYAGEWHTSREAQATLGALRRTDDAAASVAFRFQGTELTLVAPVGPELGALRVTIDGRDKTVDLSAPRARPAQSFTLARRLAGGTHAVTLRPADERPVAVDALVVAQRPLWLQPALIVAVTVIWGLGLYGMLRRWLAATHAMERALKRPGRRAP